MTSPAPTSSRPTGEGHAGYPLFFGWTPPGEGGSDFVLDPAMLGTSGATTTYSVPELSKGSKRYQELVENLQQFDPALFSATDRKTPKLQSFQNWFQKAPKNYQESMKNNPGTALDDFADFMNGGKAYGPVAEVAGEPKTFDWSSYNLLPQHGDKDVNGTTIPYSETHNPARENYLLDAPIIPNAQETLPLGFAPRRAPIPIYRIIPNDVLNLYAQPERAPHGFSQKQKEFFLQQQRGRLRRIDQIINGPAAKRNSKNDRDYFEQVGEGPPGDRPAFQELEGELFSSQPTLSDDAKWEVLPAPARTTTCPRMRCTAWPANSGWATRARRSPMPRAITTTPSWRN